MGKVVTAEAQRFMMECLMAAGAGKTPALQQAELLIRADEIGHPSHGLNRLGEYLNNTTKDDLMDLFADNGIQRHPILWSSQPAAFYILSQLIGPPCGEEYNATQSST